MSVLYPPTILDNVSPIMLFYEENVLTGFKIEIPFSYGRATSPSEITGIKMIIKGVPSNDLLTITPYDTTNIQNGIAVFEKHANGSLPNYFEIGMVYKILIAFYFKEEGSSNEVVGYYSTPAIVKATTIPSVIIEEAHNKNEQEEVLSINADYGYITKVTFKDQTDSLYSTQLIITESKEKDGEMLKIAEYKSDVILHNSSDEYIDFKNQEKYQTEACNIYVPYQVEDEDHYFYSYKIKSEIKTVNGLIVQSEDYLINNLKGPSKELKDSVWLKNDENGDGYNQVSFGWNPDEDIINNYQFFYFVLQKKMGDKKYVNIIEGDLSKLKYTSDDRYELYHKDFIIDFATPQYYRTIVYFKDLNNNSNSLYVVSPDILELLNYFEYTYLFDGQRQLTLAYNTEISGFKNNILENKIETIGSQYPVFFRNGVVNYKEIQVTSLISMLTDGNNMFSDNGCSQFFIDKKRKYTPEKISAREEQDFVPTTDLVDINIKQERLFREEVYNWLTDGKVKLFKSPTEGTFFIRIMNVSLSPNQQLARMLYSVSFTAYEVGGLENNDIEYLLKENGYE